MGQFLHDFLLANYRTFDSPYGTALQGTLNPESDCTSGWSNSQFGTGGSASQSTVTATDGLGSWRRISTNNPVIGTNTTYFSRSNIAIPSGWNHVDGQLLQPILECRLTVESILGIDAQMGGGAATTSALSNFNPNNYETHQPFEGVFYGVPVAANASSLLSFTIMIRGTVDFDVRRFGFRKVNSMYPPFV
jgi:hypothetical protein